MKKKKAPAPIGPRKPIERVYQPSMSHTDDLLGCGYPFGRTWPVKDDEYSTAGKVNHKAFEHRVRRFFDLPRSTDTSPTEAVVRAEAAFRVFKAWYRRWTDHEDAGRNYKLKVTAEVETSYAFNVRTKAGRRCKSPDDKTHEYPDRGPSEIPGTLDLLLVAYYPHGGVAKIAIIDFKSGINVSGTPEFSGQLTVQALAVGAYLDETEITLGFLHAPADGVPVMLTHETTLPELQERVPVLRQALKMAGRDFIRPWQPKYGGTSWCSRCPAWDECPASARSALVDASEALSRKIIPRNQALVSGIAGGKIVSRERLGEIIRLRSAMHKVSEQLGPMIQADIEANGSALHGDTEWTVIEVTQERLSKGTLERGLGKIAAMREIDRLRDIGGLEETTSKKIQPRKAT